MATNLGSELEVLLSRLESLAFRIVEASAGQVKPSQYSVGIIGTGKVGTQAAVKVVDRLPEVGKLILSNRHPYTAMSLSHELRGMKSSADRQLGIETCDYRSLERMLQADIIVVTAGANVAPGQDRDELLNQNLPAILHIAEQLNGYKGAAIIVTNPVEPLTYAFALHSGIDPARVTGLTHIDTLRLRVIVEKALSAEYRTRAPKLNAYIIGAHDKGCMIPVYSQAILGTHEGTIPLEALRFVTDEFKEAIRRATEDYGPEIKEALAGIGETSILTADAITQVIAAITGGEETVCAATFLPKREIYTGWPVRFRNYRAEPQRLVLSDSEQAEFDSVQDGIETTLSNMRQKGLISGYVRAAEEPEHRATTPELAEIKMVAEQITSALRSVGPTIAKQTEEAVKEAVAVLQTPRTSESAAANLMQRIHVIRQEARPSPVYVQPAEAAASHALQGNKILAAARTNGVGYIYIVDIETGAVDDRRLSTINSAVGLTVADLEGRKAILAGTRMGIQQWSPETIEVERTYRAPRTDHRIHSIGTITRNGEQYIVAAARDGLYVWRSTHPIPIRQTQVQEGIRQALTIDDKILASNAAGGITVFDTGLNQTGSLNAEEVTCLASYTNTAGKTYVFAGERQATVSVWVYEKGRFVPMTEKDAGFRVNCIDGAEINGELAFVTGTYGWGLKLIYPESGKAQEFSGHREDILAVSIAKIGNTHYIAAGNKKGMLYCWDIKSPDKPQLAIQLGQGIEAVRICGF